MAGEQGIRYPRWTVHLLQDGRSLDAARRTGDDFLAHSPGELMQVRHLALSALIPTGFLLGTFVNTGFRNKPSPTRS
jgi:hypothetical protein